MAQKTVTKIRPAEKSAETFHAITHRQYKDLNDAQLRLDVLHRLIQGFTQLEDSDITDVDRAVFRIVMEQIAIVQDLVDKTAYFLVSGLTDDHEKEGGAR